MASSAGARHGRTSQRHNPASPRGVFHGDVNESVENIGDLGERHLKRKVTRQVKRPYTKKVKVPIKTHKIVDAPEVMRVKIKKWAVEDGVEEVVEKETVLDTIQKTRDKEVWKKQEGVEEYDLSVPVVKKQRVKREFTDIEEKEIVTDINVEGARVLTFPAYRIDEIPVIDIIEREEWLNYDVYAHAIGVRVRGQEREVGRKEYVNRIAGTVVFPKNATELDGLVEDPYPDRLKPLTYITIGPTTSRYSVDEFVEIYHEEGGTSTPRGLFVSGPFIIRDLDPQENFLTIQNISPVKHSLNGWRLHDQSVQERDPARPWSDDENVFDFSRRSPNLVLSPNDVVTVYWGPGSSGARIYDNVRTFHWTNRSLFTNARDVAYLIDEQGEIRHTLSLNEEESSAAKKHIHFPHSKQIQYEYRHLTV